MQSLCKFALHSSMCVTARLNIINRYFRLAPRLTTSFYSCSTSSPSDRFESMKLFCLETFDAGKGEHKENWEYFTEMHAIFGLCRRLELLKGTLKRFPTILMSYNRVVIRPVPLKTPIPVVTPIELPQYRSIRRGLPPFAMPDRVKGKCPIPIRNSHLCYVNLVFRKGTSI